MPDALQDERLRRWRLILGGHDADGTDVSLTGRDLALDRALEALYDSNRKGGLGASSPNVPRWLGDIREYFPASVVRVMQKDAMDRLGLRKMLLEPEILASVEADVSLVATLLSLQSVLPQRTRATARMVVDKVVRELMAKLQNPMRQAVTGAISRAQRTRRPRHADIDWHRTIRANLRHYQAEYQTVIPEARIGYGRRVSSLPQVTLCVDQSGSMASSVVYSAIFGAVMASIPAVRTRLVVFDTAVVDLTEQLQDPVDVLFATQLGGGTDINRAVGYCQGQITDPTRSIFVLISDLYEGGVEAELLRRVAAMIASGVQCIVLLALSDTGAPSFDRALAAKLAALGAPAFACTPDLFPDLMAAALSRQDISQWVSERGITRQRPAD